MTSLSPFDVPTMFEQRNTTDIPSITDHHERFPSLQFHNRSSFSVAECRQIAHHIKLSRLFRLVLPYLIREQLQQLQLVCRGMDVIVREYVWRRPSFHHHPTYDPLVVFRRFLAHLPHLRPITQQTIHELCLSPIEESLYDRVPKDFFTTLTRYTPALQNLNLSRTIFFSASSLPQYSWKWNELTSLDLSFVEHMSDPLLVQLAVSLPNLCLVRLDGTRVNHGVGQLAHHCDRLSSLSLKKTTLLTDEALIALAKFRTIHVTELDISECRKISFVGLDVVARYCVHLSWLGLAHTPVPLATLRKWDHRFWKYLDIAYCTQLHEDILGLNQSTSRPPPPPQQQQQQQQQQQHRDDRYYGDILATSSAQVTQSPQSLYDLIINAPQLQHLSLSMPVIQHLLTCHRQQPQSSNNKLIDVDDDAYPSFTFLPSVSKVDRLVIHDLPEHTPLSLLDDLIILFPKLHHLKLVRGYYQTDYMHLSFSPDDDNTNKRNTITEETIKSYRSASNLSSIILEQRRDLLDGASMW